MNTELIFKFARGFGFKYFSSNHPHWTHHTDRHKKTYLKWVPQYTILIHTNSYSGSSLVLNIHLLSQTWLKSLWLGFWVASGSALQWTLVAGTDGPTKGRLAQQSWSPLLPREARFLALPLERASSQGHAVHLQSPAHGKGSPSWKKRERWALYSVLIYYERRLTSCIRWEYYLIHYSSETMGFLLKLSTLKTVCIR